MDSIESRLLECSLVETHPSEWALTRCAFVARRPSRLQGRILVHRIGGGTKKHTTGQCSLHAPMLQGIRSTSRRSTKQGGCQPHFATCSFAFCKSALPFADSLEQVCKMNIERCFHFVCCLHSSLLSCLAPATGTSPRQASRCCMPCGEVLPRQVTCCSLIVLLLGPWMARVMFSLSWSFPVQVPGVEIQWHATVFAAVRVVLDVIRAACALFFARWRPARLAYTWDTVGIVPYWTGRASPKGSCGSWPRIASGQEGCAASYDVLWLVPPGLLALWPGSLSKFKLVSSCI